MGGRSAPRTARRDAWELYDTTTDWTQAHDLAAEKPDKLAELQELFLNEGAKYNVLPIDEIAARARSTPRSPAAPDLMARAHVR